MRCVILGAGSVGFQIAKQLSSEGWDVVLIEKDQEIIRTVSNKLDCLILEGAIPNFILLHKADIESANYFIATTDSDEVNMISCGVVAAEAEKPVKIARVRNIEYSHVGTHKRKFLDIDFIVNPDIEAAEGILDSIASGAMSEVITFAESDIQIRDFFADENTEIIDMKVSELFRLTTHPFLITTVLRKDEVLVPSGDFTICKEDVLYIAAKQDHFDTIVTDFGKRRRQIRKIVIIGGGRIGRYLAERLLELQKKHKGHFPWSKKRGSEKVSVCIVDYNMDVCKKLALDFSEALIIHANLSEEDIFEDENIKDADLVISVTDNQEFNIVAAQYAKARGIKHSIALVIKNSYTAIASKLGIDVAVSKKAAVIGSILRYIRRHDLKSFHTILEGRLEIWELEVSEDSPAARCAIKELDLGKGNSLIVGLSRSGEEGGMRLPGGEDIIFPFDHIVLIAEQSEVEKLDALFAGKQ